MRNASIALLPPLAFVCLFDPNVAFASAALSPSKFADGALIGTSGRRLDVRRRQASTLGAGQCVHVHGPCASSTS